jgi:hypothetical protein
MRRGREDLKTMLSWEDTILKKKSKIEDKDIVLTAEDKEIKKKEKYTVLHGGVLLCYACQNSHEGRQALRVLIRSLSEYSTIPTYVLEYEKEKERLALLFRLGFTEVENLETPFPSCENQPHQVKLLAFKPPDFEKAKEMLASGYDLRSQGMKNLKNLANSTQLTVPDFIDGATTPPGSISPRGGSGSTSPRKVGSGSTSPRESSSSSPLTPRSDPYNVNTYNYFDPNYNNDAPNYPPNASYQYSSSPYNHPSERFTGPR